MKKKLPVFVKSVGRKQNIMFLKYSETYLLNSFGVYIPYHVSTYVLAIVRIHPFLFGNHYLYISPIVTVRC